jgi:hypothetical protein
VKCVVTIKGAMRNELRRIEEKEFIRYRVLSPEIFLKPYLA